MIGGIVNEVERARLAVAAPFRGSDGYKNLREHLGKMIQEEQQKIAAYQRKKAARGVLISGLLEFDTKKKGWIAAAATIVAIAAFVFTVSVAPKIFTPVYTAIFAGSLCLIHNFTASDSFREKGCVDELKKLNKSFDQTERSYLQALERERNLPAPPPPPVLP